MEAQLHMVSLPQVRVSPDTLGTADFLPLQLKSH